MSRWAYWACTAVIVVVMLYGLTKVLEPGAFEHLGLPRYFAWELTIAKVLGLVALLFPRVPERLREAAYFGFALTLASASLAHAASGDALRQVVFPLVLLGPLGVSYYYWRAHAPRSARANQAARHATATTMTD